MASLSPALTKNIKVALNQVTAPWILAGYDIMKSPSDDVIGILDWRLHGILSTLAEKKSLEENQLTYVPSKTKLGAASLLLFTYKNSTTASSVLVNNLQSMKVESLCLFELTFPQDFLPNLKQTLTKAGIRWTMFEVKPAA